MDLVGDIRQCCIIKWRSCGFSPFDRLLRLKLIACEFAWAISDAAPEKSENWEDVVDDIETKIMPGVAHWNHPNFHAYFPAGNSYPSILGDMLSSAMGSLHFTWVSFSEASQSPSKD